MAKFLYLYSGGQMAETPEAQQEEMEIWTTWFSGLGDSVVDIGNPFAASSTVTAGGAPKARRPSWAAIRSSTLNLSRKLHRRQTDVPSCSPAAALRYTRLCLCDLRDPADHSASLTWTEPYLQIARSPSE